MTDTAEDTDPGLYLNFYGGTIKEKSVLGVPVKMKTALTSFEQAEQILQDLSDGGAENMKVQYYNWTNAGISGKVDLKAKAAGCLGGNSDWKALQSYADFNGVTLYPATGTTPLPILPSASPVPMPASMTTTWHTAHRVRQTSPCPCCLRRPSPRSLKSSPGTIRINPCPVSPWAV